MILKPNGRIWIDTKEGVFMGYKVVKPNIGCYQMVSGAIDL